MERMIKGAIGKRKNVANIEEFLENSSQVFCRVI